MKCLMEQIEDISKENLLLKASNEELKNELNLIKLDKLQLNQKLQDTLTAMTKSKDEIYTILEGIGNDINTSQENSLKQRDEIYSILESMGEDIAKGGSNE